MKAAINAGRRACRINGERDITSKEQKEKIRGDKDGNAVVVALGEV